MDNIVRALKVFVVAGGIVLLAGTVLLVVLLMLREPENPAATATPARAEPTAAPSLPRRCEAAPSAPAARQRSLAVPLPAGAYVEQVVPHEGCLILLGVVRGGRQFVAVVDPGTGARLSLLLLSPQE